MPDAPFHGSFVDLPVETLRDGLHTRSAVGTDDAMVVFNWLEADYDAPPHHNHPFDQLALIVAGVMEFDLRGDKVVVSSGQFLYIPAGVPHTARVLGDVQVLNIDVFAPSRADYAHLLGHQSSSTPATASRSSEA